MNEQEQMMQIISAISEKTGETSEKVVAMLQEIMQTEGQEGVKAFIDKVLNPEAEMFRKGGKMEAAVNKFQRGGLLSRRQLRSRITNGAGFTDEQFENSYANAKDAFRRQGLRGRNMRSAVQNAMLSVVPKPKANIDYSLLGASRTTIDAVDDIAAKNPIKLNPTKQRTVYDNIEYDGTPAQKYDQMMSDKLTTRVPMAEIGTQEDPREASLREAPWRANWGMAHDAMFMGGTGEPIVFNNNQQQQVSPETKPSFGSRLASALMMGAPTMKEKGGKINKCQGGEKVYLRRGEKSYLPDGRIVERLGNWVDVHDDDIDTVSLRVGENGDSVAMIIPRRTTDGHTWIRQMNGKWQDPNRYMVRSPHWTLNASKDELIDFIRSSFKNVKFKD